MGWTMSSLSFWISISSTNAASSKDRTGLFMDKTPAIITEATGELIKTWCMNGIKISDIETMIEECTTIDGLRHILIKYPEFRKKIEPAIYQA